jgi:hypothetical protein
MLELRVAVGMPAALACLARTLKTVVHRVQKVADLLWTDRVTARTQLGGEFAKALARPAQRRLGVAACDRLDERLQIGHKRRVLLGERFAACARASNPLLTRRLGWRMGTHLGQLAHPIPDSLAQDPCRRGHRGNPTFAERQRLTRRPQSLHSFVHHRRQALEARADLLDARLIDKHGIGVPHTMFP